MKHIYILFISIFCLILVQCKTHKVNKEMKHAMTFLSKKAKDQKQLDEIKELEVKINRGHKLYKAHCSGCHGIFTKGKDGIPDFSNEQIDSYGVAFIRRDPKNHAVAMNLSSEQIEEILTFLHMRNLAQQVKAIKFKE